MKVLCIISCVLLSFSSTAQDPFFLGKNKVITIGSSIGTPIPLEYEAQDVKSFPFRTKTDWAILPPEIEVQGQLVVKNKLSVIGSLSFRGLQNRALYVSESEPSFGSSIFHMDSFAVRTNVLNIGIGIRKFNEYAPIGKYFEIDFGYTRSFLNVHTVQKEELTQFSSGISLSDRTILPVWKTGGNYFYASFGFGSSTIVSKQFLLDYGIRASYYIGSYEYQQAYDPVNTNLDTDFEVAAGESINKLVLDNLRASYLVKVYLKFGLYD